MALFGRLRDINLFTTVNRELLGNIITQQCAFYKFNLNQTTINIYGEAADGAFYDGPTLFNCLIDRDAQSFPEGDIILYYGGYYEVETTNANQFIVGKDPDYPYNVNPLNPGLEQFGSDFSIICKTNYVPGDKPGITRERS